MGVDLVDGVTVYLRHVFQNQRANKSGQTTIRQLLPTRGEYIMINAHEDHTLLS